MAKYQSDSLNDIRSRSDCNRAVVFLHGFLGDRDDTWDNLPYLFGTADTGWDIYTLGYATTFCPDFVGVWSGDPDLTILSTMLRTQATIEPLGRYQSLALVAHSMGGLVVQRALIDDGELADRTKNVVLFGTPSAGVRKASGFRFWKRQLQNMAADSEFITSLRNEWDDQFGPEPPFDLKVVAGERDLFVPATSSLEPFPKESHRVVSGDHHSMLRPLGQASPTIRLLMSVLSGGPVAEETVDPLVLAAERPDTSASALIEARRDGMSQEDIVRAALALERNGSRDEAVALLNSFKALGTDVQGTLAGRIKRIWMENGNPDFARRALDLYQGALDRAVQSGERDQVYYHAINIAFLEFVAFDRVERAQEMAKLALQNATSADTGVWSVATQAEAYVYLGHYERALELYRHMFNIEAEPWQYASTALQAGQIAIKLEDTDLAGRFDDLFNPTAKQANGIFVGYSRADAEWTGRLCQMLAPFLRDGDIELKLWIDDEGAQTDEVRHQKLQSALESAGAAIILVSASFLGSEYITEHALPKVKRLAADGKIQLFWVYVSHAPYEVAKLEPSEAGHDISQPLYALAPDEQDAILLKVARDIKAAALGATERFKSHEL